MAFEINTNIGTMNAHAQGVLTQAKLKNALEKLSSGLRINKAADDAAGMVIADSLRSQSSALGQAVNNINEGMGVIQIADKAMDEQIKILDAIKVKAIQAASDGQSTDTRRAIQADINRLIEGLDNIGNSTSYNGQALLSGQFTNKEFQVGAYSNQSIKTSIGATTSDKIGQVSVSTGKLITASGDVALTFKQVDGGNDVTLQNVKISTSAGTGIGALAEVINKSSGKTGIKAQANVVTTSDKEILSGTLNNVVINGIQIGNVVGIKKGDSDSRLVQAINAVKPDTGVEAYVDVSGRLNLRSVDGRGIVFKADNQNQDAPITTVNGGQSIEGDGSSNYGRLSLSRLDARAIVVASASDSQNQGYSAIGFGPGEVAAATLSLRDVTGGFDASAKSAVGLNYNPVIASGNAPMGAGVTTLKGAMVVMDIAESAQKMLDKIRADIGSVQGQMTNLMDNTSVAQVNVKAAESGIRDVDFASASADFNKYSILAQSGSYAISQANALQQNVLKLLT